MIKVYQILPEYDLSKLEKVKLDSEEAYDKFLVYTFIQGTYHSGIGKFEDDLANQFSLVANSYPCDLANVTIMVIKYKNYINKPNHSVKKKRQYTNLWRRN